MKKIFTLILMAGSLMGLAQDNVTFVVDMNQYGGSTANGVFVNGTFNNWCGSCNPMTDANSDGVWEVTLPITGDTMEYKFTIDGWSAQENFAGGEPCTVTNGGFTNRYLTRSGAVVLDTVCFNACAACTPLPPQDPTMGATAPTYDAADVISMFSDAYTDVAVNTWRTGWSNADFSGTSIGGDSMHLYNNLDFVGIETLDANSIDVSSMEHFNVDVWSPNATTFRVKLVDFGADNAFGGGDDTEHELVFDNHTTGAWVNHHIDLNDFTNLTGKSNISQLIFSAIPAGSARVYVDNIFFSKEAIIAEPMTAAADPTDDEANVISLFSGVYTDVTVDTWRTSWSNATLEDVQVAGNDVKKYSMLDFVGVETVGDNSIDASTMTHINFDAWTPNATTYRIKLVDFGADNAFGGGDDTEHEVAIEMPATETWNNHKIALADMTGLAATANISQVIFSALPTADAILYLDNVFFSKPESGSISAVSFDVLKVYPNPTNETLNLNIDASGTTINNYSIVNVQGQTVLTNDVNSTTLQTSIDLSDVSTGVYFLNINTDKGSYTHRVIVQ